MKKLLKKLLDISHVNGKDHSSKKNEPDVFIISYPKCGRTWLRALIGRYITLKYNLAEDDILATQVITKKVGLLHTKFTHSGWDLKASKRYNEVPKEKNDFQNRKMILLGRDIKDTLVSAYFQATNRIGYFEGSISDFLATDKFGVEKIMEFYKFFQEKMEEPDSFLFVRYEDLHEDAEGALATVLAFIGEKDIEEDLLKKSVEYCAFEKMKRMEARDKFDVSILRPRDPEDPESYKVRNGEVGGHTKHLSEEDLTYINNAIDKYNFDFNNFKHN